MKNWKKRYKLASEICGCGDPATGKDSHGYPACAKHSVDPGLALPSTEKERLSPRDAWQKLPEDEGHSPTGKNHWCDIHNDYAIDTHGVVENTTCPKCDQADEDDALEPHQSVCSSCYTNGRTVNFPKNTFGLYTDEHVNKERQRHPNYQNLKKYDETLRGVN